MSDKFDMKLVIDGVTTPLLYARLSAAASYRERAALLRSLAESALRGAGQLAGQDGAIASAPVSPSKGFARSSADAVAAVSARPEPDTRSERRTTGDEAVGDSHNVNSHDINMIADEFAAYLGG